MTDTSPQAEDVLEEDYPIYKDEGLFRQFHKHSKESYDGLKDWREDAQEELNFASGHQWTDSQAASLNEVGKPALVFNQVHRVLSAVSGSEMVNRFEPRFQRKTMEPNPGVDIANAWVRHHRKQSHALHEESKAVQETLTIGVGWTNTEMDYDTNPDGIMKTVRVPTHDMMWDPAAQQQNLADMKYCYRGKWMPMSEFNYRFDPDKRAVRQLNPEFDEEKRAGVTDASRAWMYLENKNDWVNYQRDEVLVIEYQYVKNEEAYIVNEGGHSRYVFPDEMEVEFPGVQQDQLDMLHMGTCKRYYRALICGDWVIEHEPMPYRGFTYKAITGFEDRKRKDLMYFGLMRLMKDPQLWTNKFLSQVIHTIGSNAKGGILVAQNAFENRAEAKRQWAQPDGWIELNTDDVRKVATPIPQSPMNVAMFQMLDMSMDMVPHAGGVNMSYLGGQAEDVRRASGQAVSSIQTQALAALAPLFDGFKRYRKEVGELYLDFMRNHAVVGEVVRISGPPYEQYAQLTYDVMHHRYDVEIDESPASASNPMETWKTLTDQGLLMQLLGADAFPISELPYLAPDIPQRVRDSWRNHLEAKMQAPPAGPPNEGELP